MKKAIFITSYLLSILTNQVSSQPIYVKSAELNTQINESKEYVARDCIKMTPGFSFSSSADKAFKASVDESLLFDVEYQTSQPDPNRTLDYSLSVGSIPGSFDVSPTGAATYTIPIEVPPGTAGMQPNLAITYNSQGGNGLLGIGWNLSGLSAITRVGKTIYHDGTTGGVSLDANDRYALDGSRLINLSGDYGGNDIEYRTEVESFAVIKSYDSNGDNHPEYYKVWTKEGQILEYGNSTDSKIVKNNKALFWFINRITDVFGNYIEFKYTTINNEIIISQINYTGSNSTTPFNQIQFFYSERTADQKSYYMSGNLLNRKLLLRKINVNCEGNRVSEYVFTYTSDILSQLIQVDLLKSSEKVNSTIINYGNSNVTLRNSTLTIPAGNYNTDIKERYWSSGDINNDGLEDLICVFPYKKFTNELVDIAQIFTANLSTDGKPSFSTGNYHELPKNIVWEEFNCYNSGLRVNNLNGDNTNDIIVPAFDRVTDNDGNVLWCNIEFYILNENKLLSKSLLTSTTKMPAYNIKDLNGDGIDDIVYVENSKVDNKYQGKIIFNKSDWSTPDEQNFNLGLALEPKKIFLNDYNSDGLPDVMVVTDDGYYIYKNDQGTFSNITPFFSYIFNSQYSCLKEGDFNGDGLMDFILNEKENQNWHLALNNGNRTFTKIPLSQINAYNDKDTGKDDDKDDVIVTDFNNDGKSDIIIRDARYRWEHDLFSSWKEFDKLYVLWYKSTGNNLELVKQAISTNVEDSYGKYYVAGDFNGDGREELMNYGFDCYNGGGTTGWRAYHTFNSNFDAIMVNAITDGFNRKTEIQYRPLSYANISGDNFYSKSNYSTYPLSDLQVPIYCVLSAQSDNGLGGSNILSYKYKGAKIHRQGKGFLGFSEISTTNFQTGMKTTASFYQELLAGSNRYFLSLPHKTSLENTITETSISESENIYTITEIDVTKKRIYPWLQKNTSQDLIKGTKTVTTNVFNSDGNLTNSTIKFYNGTGYFADVITTYSNYADRITIPPNVNTYPNMPGTITVSKTHDDDVYITHTRRTDYIYKNTGQVDTVITDPLLTKKCTTAYEYYTNGKLKKTILSATGLANRFTSYNYDAKGRFLTKVTDALGNFTEKACDEKTGNIVMEKDVMGNSTFYAYDGLGRLKETWLPTGKKIEQSINWYTGTELTDTVYYTTTSPEGAAPVKTYFDLLGRELRTVTKNIDGTDIIVDKEYNDLGLLERVSTPYFSGYQSSAKWTVYEYDDPLYRLTEETFDGIRTTGYEYDGRTATITNTSVTPNQWSEKTVDALGNIVQASDNGGTINYKYNASGQVKEIQAPGSTVTITYDEYGRQHTLTDPDAGTITYNYNAFGELNSQTDARNKTFTMVYDQLGRITSKTNNGLTTNYEYYTSGIGNCLLKKVTGPNNLYDSYTYDGFGRDISKTSYIDADKTLITETKYDDYGRISELNYKPYNFAIYYLYNSTYGNLSEVKRKDNNQTIWKAGALNEFGQWKDYTLGNNLLKTQKTYNAYGQLQTLKTHKISDGVFKQDMEYSFNSITGNLEQRKNHMHNISGVDLYEDFHYDELNRLEWYKVNGGAQWNINYNNDKEGNITHKDLTGDYQYLSSRPHALTELNNAVPGVPSGNQTITYNSFNKIETIIEGNKRYEFIYGPMQDRKRVDVYISGYKYKSIYYHDGYEIDGYRTNIYIAGGDGLAAIYSDDDEGHYGIYYVLKDHLGSFNTILNSSGEIYTWEGQPQDYSFDAWGRRRNPNDWSYNNVPSQFMFARGFTGHEHLDEFNLINMNGRIYDPYLGRFLSPDNYVQFPDFTQNYNRYAYCFNNPLIYTDPDGELAWFVPIIIGAAIFGTGNLVAHAVRGDVNSFGDGLKYFGQGALAGAVLGAAWQFAPLIPGIGPAIQTGMTIYGKVHLYGAAASTISGLGQGIFTGDWNALGNAGQIFLGNFYLDENRSFFGGVWQGTSRHTWEFIQTGLGHSIGQLRNTFGGIDDVDYFGGATLINSNDNSGHMWGFTLGSFINSKNLNIEDEMFRHEYGHALQGERWGLLYPFAIGIPSAISSNFSSRERHRNRWYERGANRYAERYYRRYLPNNLTLTPWDDIRYPRH